MVDHHSQGTETVLLKAKCYNFTTKTLQADYQQDIKIARLHKGSEASNMIIKITRSGAGQPLRKSFVTANT